MSKTQARKGKSTNKKLTVETMKIRSIVLKFGGHATKIESMKNHIREEVDLEGVGSFKTKGVCRKRNLIGSVNQGKR